jgi:hypothetical protein
MCAPIVTAVMAEALGRSVAEIGTYRPRAPFKPITVGALADLALSPTASNPPPQAVEGRVGVGRGLV